jgi:phage-related protein
VAGPEVGDIYLGVHADTKGLGPEIRRAAAAAGKDFSKGFQGSVAQSMSGFGNDIRAHLGGDKLGRLTAKDFAKGWQDDIARENLSFDIDLRRALQSADFGPLLKDAKDVELQVERIRSRITTLGKGGAFTLLGKSAKDAQGELNGYITELNKQAKALTESQAAEEAAAAAKKAAAEAAKAAKAADAERTKELQRQQQVMKDWAKQMSEGVRAADELRRSGNMKESVASLNEYRRVTTEARSQLQELTNAARDLNKQGKDGSYAKQLKEIDSLVKELGKSFKSTERQNNVAVAGMRQAHDGFADTVRENTDRIRSFDDEIKNLGNRVSDIKVRVQVESDRDQASREGNTLGSLFASAFRKATAGLGRGSGSRGGIFDGIKSEWNQFLYAFPAEITLLLRYIGVIGTELSALGSGIGATLTATVASLGGAVLGLGSAFAAVMPGIVYSIALGTAAMKEFESSFPETASAVQRLKDAFSEVDVPAFTREWEGSVRRFANTLAESLETDTVAENLGKAASQITDAFTGVINSPGWQTFTTSLETTIPSALVGFGRGVANLTQVLLPFLSMAAELADALGARFEAWSESFREAQTSAQGLAQMRELFDLWSDSLDVTIDLIYNLWGALSATFRAGLPAGNAMLGTLAELAGAWNEWSRSVEGQNALADWFAQGERVFDALLGVIGSLGTTLADIVTPDVITGLVLFLNTLETIIPTLGAFISIIGDDLGVIQLFSTALLIINQAVQPLIGPLSALAGVLGNVLLGALNALSPAIQFLADILTQFVGPLTNLVRGLGDFSSAAAFAASAGEAIPRALSGIGGVLENLVDGIAAAAPALAQGLGAVLTGLVEGVAQALPGLATAIGEGLAVVVQEVVAQAPALLAAGAELFGGLIDSVTNIMVTLAPALWQGLADLALSITDSLPLFITAGIEAFTGLIDGLLLVIPQVLTTIVTMIPAIINSLLAAIPALLAGAQQMFTAIIQALAIIVPQLLQAVITLIPAIVTTLTTMIPQIVTAAMQMWTGLVTAFLQVLPQLLTQLLGMLPQLVASLLSMVPALLQAALTAFTAVVQALAEVLPMVIETLTTLLPQLVQTLVDMLPQLIDTGITLFLGIMDAVLTAIPQIVAALVEMLPQLVSALIKMLPVLIDAAITLFLGIMQGVIEALPQIIAALTGLLPQILAALRPMIPVLVQAALDLFLAIVTGLGKAIPQILSSLAGLGGQIISTLGTIDLSAIGSAIMQSFLDGLEESWGAVTDFVGGIGDWIAQNKGPMSYDRRLLIPAGQAIMGGLAVGLAGGFVAVERQVRGAGNQVASTFASSLGIASPSRIFRQFGKDLMAGLAQGLLESKDEVTKAVQSIGSDVAGLQEDLIDAEADRIIEARKKANDRIRAANQRNDTNRNTLPSISATEAEKIARGNTKAIRATATKTYNEVIKAQNKLTKGFGASKVLAAAAKGASRLERVVKNQDLTLRDLANAREVLAGQMEAANVNLADAIAVRADFATSVRDSAKDFASAVSAAQDLGENFTAGDVAAQMREQLAQLKTFRQNVATLTARGLNDETLRQIVEQGVEGGSALAQALVDGGRSAISETNSLQTQINSAARGLGSDTSKTFYQAGVDSAQALVNGLKTKNSALTSAVNDLADRLVRQFKKRLGIRSPSRVLADQVGAPMGAGIVAGLRASAPDISNTLREISGGSVVVANRNVTPAGGNDVGARQVVYVQEGAIQVTPVVANPEMVANSVLDRLAARMQ